MSAVLIIDDHPLYRQGVAMALRSRFAGMSVEGAATAAEGLALLEAGGGFDLVLIDLRLPDGSGFDALGSIAEAVPDLPKVMISGAEDAANSERARRSGASGFIPKSLPVNQMLDGIAAVLEGEEFFPPTAGVPATATTTGALSLRQLEVLTLLGRGCSNKDIARQLAITERTAKAHVAAILAALGAANRTQAVVYAGERGLIAAHA